MDKQIRLSESNHKKLKELAVCSGLSMNDYIGKIIGIEKAEFVFELNKIYHCGSAGYLELENSFSKPVKQNRNVYYASEKYRVIVRLFGKSSRGFNKYYVVEATETFDFEYQENFL